MQPALWLRWPALLLSFAFSKLQEIIHILMVWMVSAGPIPSHIAFIMDGNRRFADRLHVERHIGHSHGYDALLHTLKDCFDLQVKTVTLFAFSIDNFQRPPDEVSALMDLMQTKLESLVEKKGLASEYGIQVRVLGDLSLLPHGARMAAEKAMAVTSQNSSAVLNLCISYTSTQEIVQSIQRTCDNVITALAGDDGSQGSVAMWKCKKGDTPAVGNGNVHAVWSHTARHGCVSNCDHTDMDGSMSYTCNGDYDCLNGSHKERDGGVSNGYGNCLNPYHSTEVVHGGYCQCKICGYAYANSNCNGWDVDRLVDVNHGAYVCENGLSRICDEGANNSKPEVSSKEIMAVDASDSCNNIRTSQLSVDVAQGVVVQGGVAQSVGLRNRTHKKDVVSGNSSFQDPHSVSICDRDPKQSEGTFTGEDNGYVKKAQTESRIGGFSIRELCCDSSNMDYDKCKTISQRCSSGLSDSDLLGKLRSQQYQFVNGTIRKDNDVTKEGFLSNCKCSKYCYLNDRIFKLVKDCISEEQIERHLYTEPCPPPDLLIRTSGETRLSNFLLWQTSFSHLAFCKVLWPEFSFRHLFFIILEYQRALPSLLRKRRYCNIAWKKNK